MLITVLKSKISYATITHTDLNYVGSITIDAAIMKAAHLRENERVQVVNMSNGERLETYVIAGEAGSRVIGLNGPAARKGYVGDFVFILSYGMIDTSDHVEPILINMKDR
jgi:aspartate 1-decarboxylase